LSVLDMFMYFLPQSLWSEMVLFLLKPEYRSCGKLRNIDPYNRHHNRYSNGDARCSCCLANLAGSEKKGNLNISVFGIWCGFGRGIRFIYTRIYSLHGI